MAKFINHGDMCESQKCHITTRKIEFKKGGLRRDPITDKLMVVYDLDRNCTYEILEKLTLVDPLELDKRTSKNVHMEEADSLIADAIRVYVDSKRNCLKPEVKEGVSGRHGGSLVKVSLRTIGMITTPLDIYKKLLGLSSDSKDSITEN